ncbi:MAG TPA: ABC transporter permease [Mycobacteriales bacterium]|jgi:ABC-2 type transport system permease protein|nr:ABC transporter permease [Mycobacteriales bacterium]
MTMTATSHDVAPVAAAGSGFTHELRAVWIVWLRDMSRVWGDKARLVSTLLQPLLFLFVLGAGLSSAVSGGTGGADFKTFLFPGVIITGVLFTAVFSAISIVWDREFGFLREMLVAPISSSSIVIGKCLGGATIATVQSILIIALAGTVHVPYHVGLLFGLLGIVFATSFTMTAFGLVLAARVKSVQTVMPLINMLLLPLSFLSGSLFPLGPQAPRWLDIVARYNPLSYAVTASRTLVVRNLPQNSPTRLLFHGLTWFGWPVPGWLDVIVVFGVGLGLLAIACAMFSRTE